MTILLINGISERGMVILMAKKKKVDLKNLDPEEQLK